MSKEEYNNEPVFFCKSCLSLGIKAYNNVVDYCDDCGATSIGKANIKDWTRLYIAKYGESYLNRE